MAKTKSHDSYGGMGKDPLKFSPAASPENAGPKKEEIPSEKYDFQGNQPLDFWGDSSYKHSNPSLPNTL